jgi:hypothetical protein
MGCDIHAFLERKHKGKYVMVKELQRGYGKDCYHAYEMVDRSYDFFAALAGVRGEGPVAIGLPRDLSESVAYFMDDGGSDFHSHSWMMADRFCQIYREVAKTYGHIIETSDVELLREDYPTTDDRIVFAFDN